MSANLVQFPLTVSGWGADVITVTDISVGRNLQESRNAIIQDPLREFNAAFTVRSYSDIALLQAFFIACLGPEQSFLVLDSADHKVAAWQAFDETVNGSRTTFQLIKKYTVAGIGTYTRTITKPKNLQGTGGVTIRNNGSTVTNYTISPSTGIITFASAPLNGHTVDFSIDEFYVPVRFKSDRLPLALLNYWVQSGADIANVQFPDVPLVEVRNE